jgi:hypothetical protein
MDGLGWEPTHYGLTACVNSRTVKQWSIPSPLQASAYSVPAGAKAMPRPEQTNDYARTGRSRIPYYPYRRKVTPGQTLRLCIPEKAKSTTEVPPSVDWKTTKTKGFTVPATRSSDELRTHSQSVPLWVYELLTMIHNLG